MEKEEFLKYTFRKHDTTYSKIFKKEKLKLIKILGKKIKIEHIGSTAVLGLGGKGIVDILIGVNKKQLIKTKDVLIKKGYNFKPKAGSKKRLFFEKDYRDGKKVRRIHIQLTFLNSEIWKNSILVRDYLNKNKDSAKNYEKIKRQAVKKSLSGIDYRKYKHNFLQNLIKGLK